MFGSLQNIDIHSYFRRSPRYFSCVHIGFTSPPIGRSENSICVLQNFSQIHMPLRRDLLQTSHIDHKHRVHIKQSPRSHRYIPPTHVFYTHLVPLQSVPDSRLIFSSLSDPVLYPAKKKFPSQKKYSQSGFSDFPIWIPNILALGHQQHFSSSHNHQTTTSTTHHHQYHHHHHNHHHRTSTTTPDHHTSTLSHHTSTLTHNTLSPHSPTTLSQNFIHSNGPGHARPCQTPHHRSHQTPHII